MKGRMAIYTIKDTMAEEVSPPFIANNDGVAWRNFCKTIEKVNDEIKKDYELIHIGTFDTESGEITAMVPHKVNPTTIVE